MGGDIQAHIRSRAELDGPHTAMHKWTMNVQLLIHRLRNGFRPFVLRLSDGRAFPVPHPGFIAVSRHAVVVMDKQGLPVHIDPLHIVSVDDRPASKQSPSKN